MAAIKLTRSHRILVGIVLSGAVVIACIGFVGSYAAVRELAERKGFGQFAPFFPIGIDAGIVVLLALDLLLTWLRIPFPLLRQTAWLLTAATIAFNGAVSWPDPLGVGMHAIIPVLFIITVEAARHAIGRIADITADRHMEGVRFWRWLLSPFPTFLLWRRMKLWELRSYEEVIALERDRLVYQAKLRARYGRAWRRRAPVGERMPLKLARYGVPLHETAPLLPAEPGSTRPLSKEQPLPGGQHGQAPRPGQPAQTAPEEPAEHTGHTGQEAQPAPADPGPGEDQDGPDRRPVPAGRREPAGVSAAAETTTARVTVPVSPGRRRSLGSAPSTEPQQDPPPAPAPARPYDDPVGMPDDMTPGETFFHAYRSYITEQGAFPTARQLSRTLHENGVRNADGSLLSEGYLRPYMREFKERYNTDMGMAG
ncbi:DUF2637 domain-containing protein [Streptomyces sp. ACA25]|uniref:DUF2637 domain-containing protein n=1 Tax=Streptomyces sp. ACA25 TaxID=3022596 RepID=UPI002307D6FD|nr:DUF2637 domain-containing protein [Streptomyces sp. ACA25]MDB1087893.1 DUF2637 domain-containing protein [Streptomyces sp. ACA25]